MNSILFAKNLVKGKIAETVFAQMLRGTQRYTVLEFGYEKVIPELVQQGIDLEDGIMQTLRVAPDFAVIDQKDKGVHLVEVKYQRHINPKYVFRDAERMTQSWNPSFLFIATLDGFYFGEISEIIRKQGIIQPLPHTYIAKEVQVRYLQILIDFESPN